MGSRIRVNPDKLFEVFAEIAKPQQDREDPFILQVYPPDYDDKDVLNNIPKFAFPCKNNTSQVDQFTFVLTDLESNYRFGYCRHGTGAQTGLCIVSCLPWFEVFYKMLNFLAEIINRTENNKLMPFLEVAYGYSVPGPEEPVTIVAGQDMFNFTAPDPTVLPSIPASRNLTEYYNAVDTNNMMRIFASMLHERRIMVTSKKLSRITACIHASEALLYPMHWQHLFIPVLPEHLLDYLAAPMPYLIGVHTSLMEKIHRNKMEIGDAVIVDADKNEVITEHEDLEALPEDVSSYLKRHLKTEKVKNSMMESGDAISKAFLQALVRLIGGYRDALKFRPDAPITFDRESFVQSRSSQSMQAFLENMLHLQIFQQFINGRLELLNNGEGFYDLFEQESIRYADRLGTQSKYKEWLAKHGRKLKAGGKDILSDWKERVKTHGKKAILRFREINDNKMSSQKVSFSKGISYTKGQRPSTIVGPKLSRSRPPRPPPPVVAADRPHTMATVERSKTYKTLMDNEHSSHDDMRLSYHRVSVDLMSDLDIQNAMMRSASVEILPQIQHDQASTPLSGSEEDVSTPSSDAQSPSDDNTSNVSYVEMHGSAAQEASPIAASSLSEEDLGQQRVAAETGPQTQRLVPDHPIIADRLIATKSQSGMPAPTPRSGRKGGNSHRSVSSSPQLNRPVPAPRRASLEKGIGVVQPTPPAPPVQHEKPLIRFESSESETDPIDQFDPLRSHTKATASPSLASAGQTCMNSGVQPLDEGQVSAGSDSPKLDRRKSSRNSLMRAPAFRRQEVDSPMRSTYRDDVSPEKETGSRDDLADLFDPLVNTSNSSSISLSKPGSLQAASLSSTARAKPSTESPESLMHDWTLDNLAGGSGFSRLPSGGTLTCPSPNSMTSAPPPPRPVPPMVPAPSQPSFPNSSLTSMPRPTQRPHTVSVDSLRARFEQKSDPLDSLLSLNSGQRAGAADRARTEKPRSQPHSVTTSLNTQFFQHPQPDPRNPKPQWETFD